MKRILIMLLVFCMLFAACGGNEHTRDDQTDAPAVTTVPETTTEPVQTVPQEFTDANGNVYSTVDADELCRRIQKFKEGTLAPEEHYFQIELKITNDGVDDLGNRLYLNFYALETNERVNDQRTVVSPEGYCFSDASADDKDKADVCFNAEDFEVMRAKWDELESRDVVLVRGKIIKSRGGTYYFDDDTKGYSQKLIFAVTDIVLIEGK